jgi:hypothetical protein
LDERRDLRSRAEHSRTLLRSGAGRLSAGAARSMPALDYLQGSPGRRAAPPVRCHRRHRLGLRRYGRRQGKVRHRLAPTRPARPQDPIRSSLGPPRSRVTASASPRENLPEVTPAGPFSLPATAKARADGVDRPRTSRDLHRRPCPATLQHVFAINGQPDGSQS